ncbi:MAG: LamG domain-containing protein [Lamprocystis purpurea]|nr:LamG domain-containing protein [Lamprocystis purpurea]
MIDPARYATVDGNTQLLEVGKDNSDFSVSFWIYLQGRPTQGEWPALLFKGDPAESDGRFRNRTFALFLNPDSNRIHFRITTDRVPNAGGDSNTELTLNRWTHVAYVKAGQRLRLYIDGRIDAEVLLDRPCVANAHPLLIGRAPNNSGFTGAFDDLRIYAFGLAHGDVAQLALDRRSALPEAPVSAYHRHAYERLLNGLGTSFEEIRGLNLLTPSQREALAQRLGRAIASTY